MTSDATLRADPATVMNAIEDAKHEGVPEECVHILTGQFALCTPRPAIAIDDLEQAVAHSPRGGNIAFEVQTMPPWRLLALLCAIALICGTSMEAQDAPLVMPTSVRIEENLKLIVDTPTRCATTASAVMFLKREDGSEQELWHRPLPNNPDWWRLDGQSGWFVTFGNACSYALAHAVIVYDSAGRIVADRSVADLFTPEERRMMGWTVLADTPRDLADDKRTGSDIFSASKVVFADDGVWLTHNRVERRVLLTRR